MYRRDFLVRTGQAIGAVALASALRTAEAMAKKYLCLYENVLKEQVR